LDDSRVGCAPTQKLEGCQLYYRGILGILGNVATTPTITLTYGERAVVKKVKDAKMAKV
jgi:hypothetical protein